MLYIKLIIIKFNSFPKNKKMLVNDKPKKFKKNKINKCNKRNNIKPYRAEEEKTTIR